MLRIPPHLIVAASAWVSRIVMALVHFASIRILMNGLGIPQYAIFALLTGLSGWFMLADFGVGSSLQNHLSEQRAKSLGRDAYVVAAAILASVLAVFTIAILYFSSPYIAPILFVQYPALNHSDKAHLFFITGSMSIVSVLAGISYKVWYAEHKGHLSNMMPAIASLVGYAGILWVHQSGVSDKLLWSIIVFIAPSALLPLISFSGQVGSCFGGGIKQLNGAIFVRMLKRACPFWIFALMSNFVLQIDYFVMSQFLRSEDIVAYNLSTKIFGLTLFIYVSVLTALWPLFSEAIAQGNWAMVRSHTRKYLGIGMGWMLVSTILLIGLMPKAIQLLAPRETIVIPVMLILLLGGYNLLRVWTDTFSMILLSMSDLTLLWMITPLQAFISVASQWYLVQLFGLYGILLGLTLSFVLTASWILPWAVYRHYGKYATLKT